MWMGGQHHAPAALPPGKTRYPLYRRLGGPQGRSGGVRKNLASTGIRSPDSPSRSESLYQLSYPGPPSIYRTQNNFFKHMSTLEDDNTFRRDAGIQLPVAAEIRNPQPYRCACQCCCHLYVRPYIPYCREILNNVTVAYPVPSTAGSVIPARSDRLKIFTLNRKDRVTVAESLGLGVKALIGTVER